MDINNEIKSLPLFKEIDKYANEIKCIFKEYNFNVEKEEIMPFASIAMFYEAHITSKAENIAKDIELYFFLNKNEEVCKLQSINNKEYYTLNNIQMVYLQPIITQYFIDNKSEIWLLFLIAHSKR